MGLDALVEMSRRYGGDEEYILAGGGNTSYKEKGVIYVKASGTQLSSITPEGFVAMDLSKLLEITERPVSDELSAEARDQNTLEEILAARLREQEAKRPSVESLLHSIFPHKYVLHTHPALINGITCGKNGQAECRRMFGDKVIWIGLVKPGLALALACCEAFTAHNERTGSYPQVAITKNHGIFAAADTVEEIYDLMNEVMSKVKKNIVTAPDFNDVPFDTDAVCKIAPALRMLYNADGMATALYCVNKQVLEYVKDIVAFNALTKPFTPDHIVYSGDEPMFCEADDDLRDLFAKFGKRKGYKPKIVAVRGLGFFALGGSFEEADRARMLFLDAIKIAVYAGSFGGPDPLPSKFVEFIQNWEAETYRMNALKQAISGRLEGKIAIVTGAAQGFGKGIAEALAAEGTRVAIADLNLEGARACAESINARHKPNTAIAIAADVTDSDAVKRMISKTVLAYGGLDILVSNAGVLIAGSLEEMTAENFELITRVNYTAYFHCTRHAANIMKIQREYAADYMMDIIEINSKSGIEGSNKNFAYAGSKFGGIGLTQSFALELAEYGIKVNAICPGNFFEGPLWSDPEKGLFRQYLASGKVKGARTIDDVRRSYEEKVPLGRGCTVKDVVCALLYVIEQKYETGQAIPVTGGQVMLR